LEVRWEAENCAAASGCSCTGCGKTLNYQKRTGACSSTAYAYHWGGWSSNCGGTQSRREIESCRAGTNCGCTGRRSVRKGERAGPCCAVNYAYTWSSWSGSCEATISRSEIESCSAASGCSCQNRRATQSQSQYGGCCSPSYVYSWSGWSGGCESTMTRSESESCSASSGCSCSGRRATQSQSQYGGCCTPNYGTFDCYPHWVRAFVPFVA
jgi:hypothetical protein